MPINRLTKMGLMLCLGLIFSYIETLFPIVPTMPGVRIGLSNALCVMILYGFGLGYAILFQFCRILISGILFSNVFSMLYSLAGAILSLFAMYICKKLPFLDVAAVSMLGGMSHNIGQIVVAFLLIQQTGIFYYLPVLIVVGAISGYCIGWLSDFLLKRRLL